jgi:hypothetical protein
MNALRSAVVMALVVAITAAPWSVFAADDSSRSDEVRRLSRGVERLLAASGGNGPSKTSPFAMSDKTLRAIDAVAVEARTQSAPAKPFWTRTKVLVAVGAAVLLAAWLTAEIRKSCRDAGPECFD